MIASVGLMVERVAKVEGLRYKEVARREWNNKCGLMLQDSMKLAHSWTNAPNQKAFVLGAPGEYDEGRILQWHVDAWTKVWKADKPILI